MANAGTAIGSVAAGVASDAAPRSVRPRTAMGRSSPFRMVTWIGVPADARIRGPGTCGGPPTSAKVGVTRRGPSGPRGYHSASTASSSMCSTPSTSRPAGARRSFGSATGRSCACAGIDWTRAKATSVSRLARVMSHLLEMSAGTSCLHDELRRVEGVVLNMSGLSDRRNRMIM